MDRRKGGRAEALSTGRGGGGLPGCRHLYCYSLYRYSLPAPLILVLCVMACPSPLMLVLCVLSCTSHAAAVCHGVPCSFCLYHSCCCCVTWRALQLLPVPG